MIIPTFKDKWGWVEVNWVHLFAGAWPPSYVWFYVTQHVHVYMFACIAVGRQMEINVWRFPWLQPQIWLKWSSAIISLCIIVVFSVCKAMTTMTKQCYQSERNALHVLSIMPYIWWFLKPALPRTYAEWLLYVITGHIVSRSLSMLRERDNKVAVVKQPNSRMETLWRSKGCTRILFLVIIFFLGMWSNWCFWGCLFCFLFVVGVF